MKKSIYLGITVATFFILAPSTIANTKTSNFISVSSQIDYFFNDYSLKNKIVTSITVKDEALFFSYYPPATYYMSKKVNGLTYYGNVKLKGSSVRQVEGGYVGLYSGILSRG